MGNLLLINVDEMWLKGGNRPKYFKILKNHLVSIFKDLHGEWVDVKNENQRFVAKSEKNFSKELIEFLQKVPGVHSLVPAMRVPSEMEEIEKAALEQMQQYKGQNLTFRVNTKRINRSFPKSSMDTSGWIGHVVLQEFSNLSVKLKNSDIVIDIKITNDYSYVSHQKFFAIGGLPVATSGHVITLLSGGFDSPVASYLMSRRGCSQDFAFFFAYPYVGDEVKEKIVVMAKQLAKFQNGCTLHVVPFGNIQKAISDKCRASYRTLMFRKYMLETATALADKIDAQALITGDSLGQVSSQTLDNIAAIESVTTLPVLRPLIGLNKRDIINLSEEIGTHDVSVIPHDDACALFAPEQPVLRPDKKYWQSFHKENDFSELISEAIDDIETFKFSATGKLI